MSRATVAARSGDEPRDNRRDRRRGSLRMETAPRCEVTCRGNMRKQSRAHTHTGAATRATRRRPGREPGHYPITFARRSFQESLDPRGASVAPSSMFASLYASPRLQPSSRAITPNDAPPARSSWAMRMRSGSRGTKPIVSRAERYGETGQPPAVSPSGKWPRGARLHAEET